MRILVTAGPTREAIDPVRYISNHSSGKMGYAVATVACERGHDVTLVSGPCCLTAPDSVRVVSVTTAAEMLAAVMQHLPRQDALIMAAAVADWRPRIVADSKMKKGTAQTLHLELERTEDILARVQSLKAERIYIGFCAETGDPTHEARRKLIEKGLDLVVANDVSKPGAGFEYDTNEVTFFMKDGSSRALPLMKKRDAAVKIVTCLEELAGSSPRRG